MNKKLINKSEYAHFSKFAKEWWLPNGKFKAIHQIIPLRLEYILENLQKKKIKNIDVMDLGCGGGLTCEPLSRLGAKVTGIDFVKKNIMVAKQHAEISNLNINYIHADLMNLKINKKFDLIILFEILEHLEDWEGLIKKIKNNLKPKGKIIISTINKNKISRFFAIFVAEKILKWVPEDTHHYNMLIKPEKLTQVLQKNNLLIKNIMGMNFDLLTREWKLNKNIYPINYFCIAELN
tara:strand:+ start:555 stop:1262 length:708 start_codon:yes stop_codon:yes gene_type:complete